MFIGYSFKRFVGFLSVLLLLFVSGILFMPKHVSGAYVASVSGIKQDSATTTSVTISWNKSMNAIRYIMQRMVATFLIRMQVRQNPVPLKSMD